MNDYYKVLGVEKNSSDKDVKAAFRRLARKHHPDLNPGDTKAEREFKKINEAYEVLSVKKNRKNYDRYGENWKHADRLDAEGGPFNRRSGHGGSGGIFGGDLSDFFGGSSHFGGRRAPAVQRLETSVAVSLEEAFAGTIRNVSLTGQGGPRTIEVKIPAGVKTGSTVRVSPSSQLKLLIKVTVQPHSQFSRRKDDLHIDVEVPFEVAALGGEAEVSTMTGAVVLTIPAGSGNGRKIRLGGKGMPVLGSSDRRGDLMATVRPTVPEDLSEEQKELIAKYRDSRSAPTESADES
jgi:DnaJ-class molecular chaperone